MGPGEFAQVDDRVANRPVVPVTTPRKAIGNGKIGRTDVDRVQTRSGDDFLRAFDADPGLDLGNGRDGEVACFGIRITDVEPWPRRSHAAITNG